MREIPGNARAWLLALALGGTSAPGLAQGRAHVQNRCETLDAAEYDELDARVLLWLSSARDRRAPPVVACDGARSWAEWAGRRWPLPRLAPWSDEVLDVLEASRREDADVEALARADTAPAAPSQVPWQTRARRAQGGGIALGWEAELPLGGQFGSVGPSFDIAVSSGPLLLGVREAFRVALTGGEGAFLDSQGLLAYGAPLRPRAPWGVALRFGVQCFVAGNATTSSLAECVPIAAGGARVALGVAAQELWLGVDLHARFSPLPLAAVQSVSDGFGVSLTLGVAFVDWSRRATP
jgi:hypothetical protein